MALTIILFAIFIAASLVLWRRVMQKIPQLVAIPDSVISQRLKEDSWRLHMVVLHVRAFCRRGAAPAGLAAHFLIRFLYGLHLALLAGDKLLMRAMRTLRERDLSSMHADYWNEVRKPAQGSQEAAPLSTEMSRHLHNRVEPEKKISVSEEQATPRAISHSRDTNMHSSQDSKTQTSSMPTDTGAVVKMAISQKPASTRTSARIPITRLAYTENLLGTLEPEKIREIRPRRVRRQGTSQDSTVRPF